MCEWFSWNELHRARYQPMTRPSPVASGSRWLLAGAVLLFVLAAAALAWAFWPS